jgi:hypothetical protein
LLSEITSDNLSINEPSQRFIIKESDLNVLKTIKEENLDEINQLSQSTDSLNISNLEDENLILSYENLKIFKRKIQFKKRINFRKRNRIKAKKWSRYL